MIDHPAFGPLRASACSHGGPWLWEALDLLNTSRGDADLGFEAGASGPGPAHETQLEEIVDELERLTAAAAPLVGRNIVGRIGGMLSNEPWAQLEWQGARLTGRSGEFHLHYWCKSWPDAMVTVAFEGGRPVGVSIDD